MEPNLISKKELLEKTGISYGQLYRWKRKNLIPEDWFIRKSTFTGQETFFPRDKILDRVNRIKDMKEDLSLDELADMFSPNPAEIKREKKELAEQKLVSQMVLDNYWDHTMDNEILGFDQIFFLYVLDKVLKTGEISLEEGKTLQKALADNFKKVEGSTCEMFLVRKLGVSTCFFISSPGEIYFEEEAKVVVRLNLTDCIEELKIRLI